MEAKEMEQEIVKLRAMRTESSIELMQEFMLRKEVMRENDALRELVRRQTAALEECKREHKRKDVVYGGFE